MIYYYNVLKDLQNRLLTLKLILTYSKCSTADYVVTKESVGVMSDPLFSKITADCQTHSPGPILRKRELATPILSRAKHIFSSLCSLYTFVLHSHIVKLFFKESLKLLFYWLLLLH